MIDLGFVNLEMAYNLQEEEAMARIVDCVMVSIQAEKRGFLGLMSHHIFPQEGTTEAQIKWRIHSCGCVGIRASAQQYLIGYDLRSIGPWTQQLLYNLHVSTRFCKQSVSIDEISTPQKDEHPSSWNPIRRTFFATYIFHESSLP